MTSRVKIREHYPDDLEWYLDWQTDPLYSKYLSWLPRNREDAISSFNESIRQQNLNDRSQYFFAVVHNDSNEYVGDVGFTLTENTNGNCGWFIRKPCQGKGYATEAVKQLMQFAYESLNLDAFVKSLQSPNQSTCPHCGTTTYRDSGCRFELDLAFLRYRQS